eukprot:Anaeramoba_ignava/a218414_12.p1 GENE.a218414_12~~a218414_12.p1  ORF type:complete len:971 (+),score=253.16 a218414_12:57-2915(+)
MKDDEKTIDLGELRYLVICIGNLCMKSGKKLSQYYSQIFQALFQKLCMLSQVNESATQHSQTLYSLVRAVQYCINESKIIPPEKQKPLLTILKRLMFFGTHVSTLRYSSDSFIYFEYKLNEKTNEENTNSENDETKNELEDNEQNYVTKVRSAALSCLQVIAKILRNKIHGEWGLFLPTNQSVNSMNLLTIAAHDPDPEVREKALSAISSLIDGSRQFLSFAEDKNLGIGTSFTPLSRVLGQMIQEIHNNLHMILTKEKDLKTIVHALNCFSVFISNISYHKLTMGYLSRVIGMLESFLLNPNSNPQVLRASLYCLGSVFSTKTKIMEVSHYLLTVTKRMKPNTTPNFQFQFISSNQNLDKSKLNLNLKLNSNTNNLLLKNQNFLANSDNLVSPHNLKIQSPLKKEDEKQIKEPTIFDIIFNILSFQTNTEEISNLALESLSVLTKLCINYSWVIEQLWEYLSPLLLSLSRRFHEYVICNRCFHLFEELLHSIEKESNEVDNSQISEGDIIQKPTRKRILLLWTNIIENHFVPHFQPNECNFSVIISILNSLASLSSSSCAMLNQDLRRESINFIHKSTSNGNANVRISAFRALGNLSLFSVVRETPGFIDQTLSSIIISLNKDKTANVRIRASWALANVCDTFCLDKQSKEEFFTFNQNTNTITKMLKDENNPTAFSTKTLGFSFSSNPLDLIINNIDIKTLVIIAQLAIKLTKDNKKIRANALRALGNLSCVAPKSFLEYQDGKLMEEIVNCFRDSVLDPDSGLDKIRWNSCYAIGSLFKNSYLQNHYSQFSWISSLISSLVHLIKVETNFKTRIHSVTALSNIHSRSCFGSTQNIYSILSDLENSLNQISNESFTVDHSSHQNYVNTLAEKIIITILKLTSLITKEEVLQSKEIQDFILQKIPNIYQIFQMFQYQNHPQNSLEFFTMLRRIEILIQQTQEQLKDNLHKD